MPWTKGSGWLYATEKGETLNGVYTFDLAAQSISGTTYEAWEAPVLPLNYTRNIQ